MYYTLNSNNTGKYDEIATYIFEQKKSKFISYIFKITNDNEAKKFIDLIKKDNKDARHVVYIYSYLNETNLPQVIFSDDGEPQGTGTKAIYELLTKENITNICVVIVRYFGGILLGAGPLSRAYLNSFRGSLDCCIKEKIYNYFTKEICVEYNKYDILISKLSKYINDKLVILDNVKYNENINITLKIEGNSKNKIEEILSDFIY